MIGIGTPFSSPRSSSWDAIGQGGENLRLSRCGVALQQVVALVPGLVSPSGASDANSSHQQISDVSRSSPPPSETVEAADVPGRTVIRFQVLDEQTSSRSIFLMPGLPRKLYVFLSSSRYLANVRWGQSLYHLRAGLAPEGYCDTPSGAHVNPAISIAMMITRNITVLRGLMFVIAQCGGGIAGAALLYG
ncbi:unnamed protein product, partial [Nesidiocoris tenuis]